MAERLASPLSYATAFCYGARATNSEMRESSAIMCWLGLVWTFDRFAHIIELREFFKLDIKKSVRKQIEISKKQ